MTKNNPANTLLFSASLPFTHSNAMQNGPDDENERYTLTERNKKMATESTDPDGCALCFGPRETEWRLDGVNLSRGE